MHVDLRCYHRRHDIVDGLMCYLHNLESCNFTPEKKTGQSTQSP